MVQRLARLARTIDTLVPGRPGRREKSGVARL